jgi:hypothetical protein
MRWFRLVSLSSWAHWVRPAHRTDGEGAVEQALQAFHAMSAATREAGQQLGVQAGLKPNPRLYIQQETFLWSQPPFSYSARPIISRI